MTIKYDKLEDWQKVFYDLNTKLGNDVWGARLEGTDEKWESLRIFISHQKYIKQILEETNGEIADLPLVFTIFSQESYTSLERKKKK